MDRAVREHFHHLLSKHKAIDVIFLESKLYIAFIIGHSVKIKMLVLPVRNFEVGSIHPIHIIQQVIVHVLNQVHL